jgi:hypothetical protein
MAADRYPKATWHPSKNFWPGHAGRRAVVIHIAQGGFSSSIKYMADHEVSSHFITSLQGAVAQMVGTEDSAWGNGLTWMEGRGWQCPHGKIVMPTWELIDRAHNPNTQTISIEHEGLSGNPWPKAQILATVDLLIWLGKKYPSLLPYRVGSTLIGHRHLDPKDKANCPGTGIDLVTLAALANAGLGPSLPPVEPWIAIWEQKGVPLPAAQVGWGIPQLYKFHASELGACLAPEQYPVKGLSVAVFERGLIYYLEKTKRAYLERFVAEVL